MYTILLERGSHVRIKWNKKQIDSTNRNVTNIENDFFQEQIQKKKHHDTIRKHVRRRMTLIVTVGTIVVVPLFSNFIGNITDIHNLNDEIAIAQDEKKQTTKINEDLKVEVGLLQNNEYLAKLARSRYYLSKDGEIIFSLPEDNQSKAATETPTNE